ncbi:MAG: DNA gyrase subunit A [Chloroflexi bacterium]|nr:DNA gyrase subunit A [Chloroflexota bacterium]
MANIGTVQQVNIEQEMRDAYLDYAMSVIVARALPDARDGLKPVHRRILFAMYDMGVRANTPYKKSARIVGEVLGKYHPHGDAAVYETMVRLAQDFSMRYMLVAGQGNFGSLDGDSAAAMRYTEARMAQIGEELLSDIDRDTVDFTENFDGSLTEPAVLPASIPNLLINGASGIAVGMSTNIPPHNLGEVCDALAYMLKNWERLDDVDVRDLMQFIKGPDFPTGGLVYRHVDALEHEDDSLVAAYATGRGKIIMRAKVHIEDMGRGKSRIIVSELPYQTNKSSLIERIANLVREGRLEGIADLRDESDRQGVRLVIELQRGAEPTPVVANLFKLTPLQETFSIIMLALVDGEPRFLTLKQALKVYLDHRQDVVRRRSEYDLARARERAHILQGLLAALDKLDAVITIIRGSRTAESARDNLRKALSISEIQAQAILDMQLRRLAALERQKIKEEFDEKMAQISYLEGLLGSAAQMREVVGEELNVIKQSYNDPRRTIIVGDTATQITTQSLLIPAENTWVTLTVKGKLGRSFIDAPPQVTTKMDEPPRLIAHATTAQVLHLFTTDGQCATIPVQQLPQINEPGAGVPFNSLCGLSEKASLCAMLCLPNDAQTGFLFLATENGEVKRLRLEDLPGMTANVFTVMDVEDSDRLGWVFPTSGEEEVLLVSKQAQAIRFKESDVRPTGLPAGGMRGIKLGEQNDKVIGAALATANNNGASPKVVWVITEDGIAKSAPLEEYPLQGRAGSGVITMKLPPGSRGLAAATVGALGDTLLVISDKGRAWPMKFSKAPQTKRAGKGDFILSVPSKERVSAVATHQPQYAPVEPMPSGE